MEHDRNDGKGAAAAGAVGQMSTAGWQEYAGVVSRAQGYELDEAQLARVVAQLELISGIAAPLLSLQLPAELEPAPVFRP